MTNEKQNAVAPVSDTVKQLRYVNPKILKLGRNIRDVIVLDPEFLEDVRVNGVETPIDVYQCGPGEDDLMVTRGFHRTHAAIETGRTKVPVLVAPDPNWREWERVKFQLRENEQRKGLTTGERVAAYEVMALDGLSAEEIAAELSLSDPQQVKAALTVAQAKNTRAVITAVADFDLFDAAAMAEFDDDPAAVEKLAQAALSGTLTHELQALRDNVARETARQKITEEVAAAKVKLVARGPRYGDGQMAAVTDLKDRHGNRFTEQSHTSCAGHVAYLTEEYRPKDWSKAFAVGYACDDYKRHGHYLIKDAKLRPADMTSEQRDQSKADRADVVGSNRKWASAEKVRREFLKSFTSRKTAPKGSAALIATAFALDGHDLKRAVGEGNRLALELLGIDKKPGHGNPSCPELAAKAATAGDARALMIALLVVLAAYEERLNPQAWRGGIHGAARYLTFLANNGYRLSDVEKRACAAEPQGKGVPPEASAARAADL